MIQGHKISAGLDCVLWAALCLWAAPVYAATWVNPADPTEYASEFSPPADDLVVPSAPPLAAQWVDNGNLYRFDGDVQNAPIHSWQSQEGKAQLYAIGGVADGGVDQKYFNNTVPSMLTGVGFDYTHNDLYTSARIETVFNNDQMKYRSRQLRLGFSGFGFEDTELGSLLMLVANFDAIGGGKLRIKPAFQLFDQDFAGEIDVDRHGDVMLNFRYRW
jgi:hypothetical protein